MYGHPARCGSAFSTLRICWGSPVWNTGVYITNLHDVSSPPLDCFPNSPLSLSPASPLPFSISAPGARLCTHLTFARFLDRICLLRRHGSLIFDA